VTDALALPDARHRVDNGGWLEHTGTVALCAVAGGLQFSIALAQIFLAIAIICWMALLIVRRERFEAPRFFWPLTAYAAVTLISAAFSGDPRASLIDSKQLVLFLVVPVTYRFMSDTRASTLITVVVTCAAASAAFGIVQYGILHYDNLGQRPQGTLGHWMTYSGLLMIVICVAAARVLFARSDRMWAAMVLPALAVAVAVTFTRGAAVGACAAIALLFAMKDFRLFAILPILAAILAVAASEQTVAKGAGLLAVYSLGLGIPFLLAALAVEPFAAFLARFRRHLAKVERVMGGLLVLTGIAFLTGFVSQASFWLLETFPALGKIG